MSKCPECGAEQEISFVAFSCDNQHTIEYHSTSKEAEDVACAYENFDGLLESLKNIFGMIDNGLLVRDITKDDGPDWALAMIRFVQRLNKAQLAIDKAERKEG